MNDGGPAFPRANDTRQSVDFEWGHDGMSLRDWFAGMALSGIMANPSHLNGAQQLATIKGVECQNQISVDVYAFADAMIAEREKVR